ncbi:MAG: DUF86 domain-containing protein [Chloroflexi bacterium]|nr:DUF86 domain-containing protein [Chloroflexota bacterium]
MEPEAFAADRKTNYATVRALEIIGEAAKRLPAEIRALDPLVPWGEMAGMRDRMIHGYDRVDLGVVWDVVRRELPALLPRIAALQHMVEEREDREWEEANESD